MKTLDQLLAQVKELFAAEPFLASPEGLYAPIDYTLALGGKRVRPVLLMAAAEMFGTPSEEVAHAALAIETFHNFTLLHDDLMDRSPLRRGQPTVYRRWGDNTAILSGDTMFALAYRYLLRRPHPQLQAILQTFTETAIQVCEGQQMDMEFESRHDVTIPEYMEMIRLKTSVLLAGTLRMGALFANAPEADQQRLYDWGIHLGLAFQLQDDLLDAYGDTATFGKATGQDILDCKKTYLYLTALAQSTPTVRQILAAFYAHSVDNPSDKVPHVLNLYNQLNVKSLTEQAIAAEFAQAEQALAAIALPDERKQTLRALAATLLHREK